MGPRHAGAARAMVSGQAGAERASEKRFATELVPGRSLSAEHVAQLRTLPGAEMIPSCAPDLRRASERASERARERERNPHSGHSDNLYTGSNARGALF